MGNRVNSVEFLARHITPAKDPVGRLMARADDLLVELADGSSTGEPKIMTKARLEGIIEAIMIITFAKEDDVKDALRLRWDRRYATRS